MQNDINKFTSHRAQFSGQQQNGSMPKWKLCKTRFQNGSAAIWTCQTSQLPSLFLRFSNDFPSPARPQICIRILFRSSCLLVFPMHNLKHCLLFEAAFKDKFRWPTLRISDCGKAQLKPWQLLGRTYIYIIDSTNCRCNRCTSRVISNPGLIVAKGNCLYQCRHLMSLLVGANSKWVGANWVVLQPQRYSSSILHSWGTATPHQVCKKCFFAPPFCWCNLAQVPVPKRMTLSSVCHAYWKDQCAYTPVCRRQSSSSSYIHRISWLAIKRRLFNGNAFVLPNVKWPKREGARKLQSTKRVSQSETQYAMSACSICQNLMAHTDTHTHKHTQTHTKE